MVIIMLLTAGAIALVSIFTYMIIDGYDNPEDNKLCGYKELKSISGDGVLLSKNVRLSEHQSNEHILMIAPSGSGKSRCFMMPNVNNLKQCSIVITDPSGEIEKTCHTDKKAYIFNPFSDNTIGYDPLQNCTTEFEVRKVAQIILQNGMSKCEGGKQQEWVDMARLLLTSYMLYNWKFKVYSFTEMIYNICTLPILSETRASTNENGEKIISKSIVAEIMNSQYIPAIAELKMFMQVIGATQTLSGVRIVMNTCLQMFLDNNISKMFLKKSIDLSIIRKEESIVYVQIPERHSEYYRPLVATFVSQLLDTLLDTDGLQTYMMFDEFCNIGQIPNMCKLLSTARKHNISIIAAVQNIIQLARTYGEIEGKELQELFKSICVCSGLKDESAEFIARLLGKKKVKKDTHTVFEDIMSADEIRRLKNQDMLIICSNKRPVKDSLLAVVV